MRGRLIKLALAAGGLCAVVGCMAPGPGPAAEPVKNSPGHAAVTPTGAAPYHGMIQYRAKDAKPAILEPELLSGDEALIAPGTKVIGVWLGGEARAYPLFVLNNHQIVNDQIGEVPLSASW